jgi:hypothetical protein
MANNNIKKQLSTQSDKLFSILVNKMDNKMHKKLSFDDAYLTYLDISCNNSSTGFNSEVVNLFEEYGSHLLCLEPPLIPDQKLMDAWSAATDILDAKYGKLYNNLYKLKTNIEINEERHAIQRIQEDWIAYCDAAQLQIARENEFKSIRGCN